ncbi:cysteine methyltransferase [Ahniella affigens]|uniref:Methylated-DNA--protein-cysteine methyltransferase n=2 Tax=Ahniella affigens TaxID=2021234 RepID=A0A2P1PSL6_9GAMM|nr:methylated-DNA--[protein]-cysteine S-methyltransferase [Ahniella affigens]AVP97839.1 cysteine methyltransferase [Ahniella affigens]
MIAYVDMDSPIGGLTLAGVGDCLQYLLFPTNRHPPADRADWVFRADAFTEARRQLAEYFAGTRQVFDLAIGPQGTAFQTRVWQTLQQIPYGETWSYADLASRLGQAKAVRAVGAANGRNPVPIIIPCHRVIGSDGSMTGFGGGIAIKQQLLELEASQRNLFA